MPKNISGVKWKFKKTAVFLLPAADRFRFFNFNKSRFCCGKIYFFNRLCFHSFLLYIYAILLLACFIDCYHFAKLNIPAQPNN